VSAGCLQPGPKAQAIVARVPEGAIAQNDSSCATPDFAIVGNDVGGHRLKGHYLNAKRSPAASAAGLNGRMLMAGGNLASGRFDKLKVMAGLFDRAPYRTGDLRGSIGKRGVEFLTNAIA